MCFETSYARHRVWRGQPAWRLWRTLANDGQCTSRGTLVSPLRNWSCWDGPVTVSDYGPSLDLDIFSRVSPRNALAHAYDGLYAYQRRADAEKALRARHLMRIMALGKVWCFGDGYESNDGVMLSCESMVIARLRVSPRMPMSVRHQLHKRYQCPVTAWPVAWEKGP